MCWSRLQGTLLFSPTTLFFSGNISMRNSVATPNMNHQVERFLRGTIFTRYGRRISASHFALREHALAGWLADFLLVSFSQPTSCSTFVPTPDPYEKQKGNESPRARKIKNKALRRAAYLAKLDESKQAANGEMASVAAAADASECCFTSQQEAPNLTRKPGHLRKRYRALVEVRSNVFGKYKLATRFFIFVFAFTWMLVFFVSFFKGVQTRNPSVPF